MIEIKNRNLVIPNEEKKIGYVDDNGIEQRVFVIPKMYGNIDLSDFVFKLDIQKADETKGIVDLVKVVNGDNIELTWNIDNSVLDVAGIMSIQVRAYQDLEETPELDYQWHSAIGRVQVQDIINAVGEYEGSLPSEFIQLENRITLAVQTTLEQIADLEAYMETFNKWEEYDVTKSYVVNNKVYYDGSSYTCIADVSGQDETSEELVYPNEDTEHWQIIASKGDQGIQGEPFRYEDFTEEQLAGLKGEQGIQGEQGFSPIVEMNKVGKINTLTITDEDGTHTTTINDGADGIDGINGTDGQDGTDGFSPIVSLNKVGKVNTLSITDVNGTHTTTINDGTDGTNGIDGTDGVSPTIETSKVGKTTTITITDVDGTHTATILDGADGQGSGDMLTSVYDPNNMAQDIFAYVDNHTDTTLSSRVSTLESTITTKANTSDVDTALNNKVDKEVGKGLSTNDYTTSEKTKLANLSNYDDTALSGRVTTIEGKIPSEASSSNKLADKNFVNSSISTNTAIFRGTFNSVAELNAYSGAKTNNDYAFVIDIDADGNTLYKRYKYNGTTWVYEYSLNNSSFTAQQWSWINASVDGTTLVNNNGVLSATAQSPAIATTSVAGIVKPDGTSISVTADGTISAVSNDIVLLTQAEYNALSPKVPTTLYVIVS